MSALPVVLKALCEGLDRAQDIDTSLDVLNEVVHHLGWTRLVYGWKSPGQGADALPVPVLTRDFPQNWDRNWSKHSPHDPYFEAAFLSREPVYWSDIQAYQHDLDDQQRDCLHYIEDLGLVDGLTVPVAVPGRRFAFVTALGFKGQAASSADGCQVEMMKLVAHFFDNHMIGLTASAKGAEIKGIGIALSRRERECLLWTAQGKTVDEVATIMGVSPETARVYVKRVIIKMNASNKTHAVAKAIHMGLVTMN
ncbi:MAG: helix-turn-helix transcriptional regulator [Polymorphobacter sp.]|uniref:helix-turn-helix transcriptional regulator n=1 Tax=Polymorphobacter sp. TaxID=1909290 RepID=UPI003A8C703E